MAAISLYGQSHSKALELARKAPRYLEQQKTGQLLGFIPFLSSTESTGLWMTYEKLILSCLRTGDEKSAHLCLERLIKRFGTSNERVMGLRGLYQEAVAANAVELGAVLHEYEGLLQEDPTNTVRLVTLEDEHYLTNITAYYETSHCASSKPRQDS